MSNYGGKPITSLTDAVLAIAETDIANCLSRAFGSSDEPKYNAYFESLSAMALEVEAEKQRRAG